jgi:hypothetical protein
MPCAVRLTSRRVALAAGVLAAVVAVALLFLLGVFDGGAEHVDGVRAGGLDAGNVVGAGIPIVSGESYMIGLVHVRNVGATPALVDSVRPESSSPNLRVTRGRIFIEPRDGGAIAKSGPVKGAHIAPFPDAWPGWPPWHLPTKPVQPRPAILSLPTRRVIPPGRTAQLFYGVFLHAKPTARTRIVALRIRFTQGGGTYIWTLPEPVHIQRTG